jgi:polyisoprenoid-binding protein YceI
MSTQSAGVRTTPIVPPGRWVVDPTHSNVQFAVKHMGIATVRGKFTEFEGILAVAKELHDSKAFGKVRVSSIATADETRDAHLRSPDFFAADDYPEIAFESRRIEAIDADSSQVFGNLTMHGVTHEVKLEVVIQGTAEDPWGNTRVGLEAVGVIRRTDFDMKFNQALGSGDMLVGDKVSVSLDISAVKQA